MDILKYFENINLTKDQLNALNELQSFIEGDNRIFILRGYAGTGKTTILKGLISSLISNGLKYQLLAPTGRAAKMVHRRTGYDATTIHKGIYSLDKLYKTNPENADENEVTYIYKYKIRYNPDVYNSIIIVDEASMISNVMIQNDFLLFGTGYLLNDLITYCRVTEVNSRNKIIFIGDPAQLPPFGMDFSPALDPKYLSNTYNVSVSSVEMREVVRQSNNSGILSAATKIRQSLLSENFNNFDLRANDIDIFNPSLSNFIEVYKSQPEPKIIICHKNKTALDINTIIRKDRFNGDYPIRKSDIVIIGANNYHSGIFNGEFAKVFDVSETVEQREIRYKTKGGKTNTVCLTWRWLSLQLSENDNDHRIVKGYMLENYLYGDSFLKPEERLALYIDFKNRHKELKEDTEEFKLAFLNDKYINSILLKFGYAVTCHKAQGGEWPTVFVFWDMGVKDQFNFYESAHNNQGKTNITFYRWAYTAITRASEKLFCINPPYFSSFSTMQYIDIDTQDMLNDWHGQSNDEIEVHINEVMPALQKFGLSDAPITIQNHFIRLWYLLQKHNIDIVAWERKGYEIWYQFERNDERAGIKYTINGKNEFTANYYVKIPKLTTSDNLYMAIDQILINAPTIIVNRNCVEEKLTKIDFDLSFEKENSFLKKLYEALLQALPNDIKISSIEHLKYRERYTLEKQGKACVIDFEYNDDGFFGRVLPLKKKCNNPQLLDTLKNIVEKLKQT